MGEAKRRGDRAERVDTARKWKDANFDEVARRMGPDPEPKHHVVSIKHFAAGAAKQKLSTMMRLSPNRMTLVVKPDPAE